MALAHDDEDIIASDKRARSLTCCNFVGPDHFVLGCRRVKRYSTFYRYITSRPRV